MAWYAIIETDLSTTAENVIVPVTYYDSALPDDTTPTKHKHVFDHVFSVPVGSNLKEIRDMVVERGQLARAAQDAAERLRSIVPVGKTIPIP